MATDVEHPFQAWKTLDHAQIAWVLGSPTAMIAKKRGRRVTLRPDWDDISLHVMRHLVWFKFALNPGIARKLLATEAAELIEGNTWHDNLWGDCRCGGPRCQVAGENRLGEILMAVRDRLWVEQAVLLGEGEGCGEPGVEALRGHKTNCAYCGVDLVYACDAKDWMSPTPCTHFSHWPRLQEVRVVDDPWLSHLGASA